MKTDRLSYLLRHEATAHGKEDYKHLAADALESLSVEVESLRSTISRLREYADHKITCGTLSADYFIEKQGCDCGYDELMAELEESK